MFLPHLVTQSAKALRPDVAESQAANLLVRPCQTQRQSARVQTGRTQAAYASQWGQWGGCSLSLTLQENRSRGCRRAHVSFWFWLQLQLLPLVPKKKCRCPSRSPRKSWTPASTSNYPERACRRTPGGPAPTFGLLRFGAVGKVDTVADMVARLTAEYQAAKANRDGACIAHVVIVDGAPDA